MKTKWTNPAIRVARRTWDYEPTDITKHGDANRQMSLYNWNPITKEDEMNRGLPKRRVKKMK